MSEAKGPYTTEPCERHAGRLKIVFYKGMISCGDRHNQQVSCDALNEAWEIGRASRDGLRDRIVEITNILLDYRDWHKQCAVDDGSDMALGAYRAWENKIKRVLKADGRGNERDRETL